MRAETQMIGSDRNNAKGANSQISTSQNWKEKNKKTEGEMDTKSRGGPKERGCKKLERKNGRHWNTMINDFVILMVILEYGEYYLCVINLNRR